MGSEAETPGDAQLSLIEALEQAVRLNDHNGMMGVRLQALREQLEHARHDELRDALEAEEKTLRHSMRVVEQQIGAMKNYFDSTTIEVNGHSMTAMQAFDAIHIMIGQRNSLERMVKGLNLQACGFKRLENASAQMKEGLQQTLDAWKEELIVLATLLMGIQVPMDRRNVFQSIWITKNVKIELVWNAETQCFEPPAPGISYSDDVQAFINSATANFTSSGAPTGTRFVVNASEGERGRKFSGSVHVPPRSPGAPPFPPRYPGATDNR